MDCNKFKFHRLKFPTTILFFIIITILSCKKDATDPSNTPGTVQNGITYPDSVIYGKNILSYPDSTILLDGTEYEIGATLETNANLSLVITNYPELDSLSGHTTIWFHTDEIGWTALDYNDVTKTQNYISSQKGNISGLIQFSAFGQTGKCKIDFYENGNTITKTKHFTWH